LFGDLICSSLHRADEHFPLSVESRLGDRDADCATRIAAGTPDHGCNPDNPFVILLMADRVSVRGDSPRLLHQPVNFGDGRRCVTNEGSRRKACSQLFLREMSQQSLAQRCAIGRGLPADDFPDDDSVRSDLSMEVKGLTPVEDAEMRVHSKDRSQRLE